MSAYYAKLYVKQEGEHIKLSPIIVGLDYSKIKTIALYIGNASNTLELYEKLGTDTQYFKIPSGLALNYNGYSVIAQVKIFDFEDKLLMESMPLNLTGTFSHISEIIKEKIDKAIRSVDGEPYALLARKILGSPCSVCRNVFTNTASDPNCPVCFGTGIEGGYYKGISVFLRKLKIPNRRYVSEQKPAFQTSPDEIFQGSAKNLMKEGDVLVNLKTGVRFKIYAVEMSSFRNIPVDQTIYAKRIKGDVIEKKIPVPPNLYAQVETERLARLTNRML